MPKQQPLRPSKRVLLKAWFRNSETILFARLQVLAGLATAVVGALDWSPLLAVDLSSGLSSVQVLTTGAVIVMIGISTEIARRM